MATNLIRHVGRAVTRIAGNAYGLKKYFDIRRHNEQVKAYTAARDAHKQAAAAHRSAVGAHRQQVQHYNSAVKARKQYFKARVSGVQAVTRAVKGRTRTQKAKNLRTMRANPATRARLRNRVKYKTVP